MVTAEAGAGPHEPRGVTVTVAAWNTQRRPRSCQVLWSVPPFELTGSRNHEGLVRAPKERRREFERARGWPRPGTRALVAHLAAEPPRGRGARRPRRVGEEGRAGPSRLGTAGSAQ